MVKLHALYSCSIAQCKIKRALTQKLITFSFRNLYEKGGYVHVYDVHMSLIDLKSY